MRETKTIRKLTKEEKAFVNELTIKTCERAHTIIRAKLGNIGQGYIDDCFQDVCYLMCLHIDVLMSHPTPEAWVYKTSWNTASNYIKGLTTDKVNKTLSLSEMEDGIQSGGMSVEDEVVENILFVQYMESGVIDKILSTLSRREKNVYDMKYKQKLSNHVIASRLDTSEDAVRAMLSSVKRKIFGNLSKFL